MERKLLAVVAADMVGFSRLVENDETSILSRQKEYFNEIIKPQIKKFHGEIIKTTGDGFLAIFSSSLDIKIHNFCLSSLFVYLILYLSLLMQKDAYFHFVLHFLVYLC